jgi:hypothetical protein
MALYEDALKLAINKSLTDIKTVLDWAEREDSIQQKEKHVAHALALLDEVRQNLATLRKG